MTTQTIPVTAHLIGRFPQFADRVEIESGEILTAVDAETSALSDRARAVIDGQLDLSEVERRVARVVTMLDDLRPAATALLEAWHDIELELDHLTATEPDRLGDAIRGELVGRMLCGPSGPSATANDIAAAITGEQLAR